MAIRSHHDLVAWQKSLDLAVAVYGLSARFPRDELYRLTAQLTRAAASVPANLAEGSARASRREFAHFVSIARGSLAEVETLLLLADRLGYIEVDELRTVQDRITEIGKMLTTLHRRLR